MNNILSARVQQIKPSSTLAISDLARELLSKGHSVINLSAGEPDFDTPDFIKQSAIKAIQEGSTKYTNVDGTPDLKEAIIHKLKRDNQLNYDPSEIIVSGGGAKQSIYNALMATLNAGDEALIPAPYWVSYPSMVQLAEAKPIIVPTTITQNFKLTAAQLVKAATSKSRLLILNSPSNPSGAAYSESELKALAEILMKYPQLLIFSDDIYEYILWGQDHFANILNVCPDLHDRAIIINGVSKAYAMTGWRIGYAAGPKSIIQAMKKIQSQSTSSPNSISQVTATTALRAEHHNFTYMYDTYKIRHDLVLKALNQMKGVRCIPADGAFYLFPDISAAMQHLEIESDVKLSTYLLDQVKVAVIPGSTFGFPGHIRLSCTASTEKLKEAMDRLASVLHY